MRQVEPTPTRADLPAIIARINAVPIHRLQRPIFRASELPRMRAYFPDGASEQDRELAEGDVVVVGPFNNF